MDSGWWSILYLLVAGTLATDIWRYLGVFAALRIDEAGEVFQWVRAASTALVAALIARLVVFAPGALADTPLLLRLAAFGAGFLVYLLARQNMLAGIAAGVAILVGGMLLF